METIRIYKGFKTEELKEGKLYKLDIDGYRGRDMIILIQNGCWIPQTARLRDGYAMITYQRRERRLSRLICAFKEGKDYAEVGRDIVTRHSCIQVKNCICPNHLCFGTQAENIKDMVRDNTIKTPIFFGSDNPFSKLKEEDVFFIAESNLSNNELATMLNVSSQTIYLIRKGKRWAHLGLTFKNHK